MSIFFISAILGIVLHFAFLIYEPKRRRFPLRSAASRRRLRKKTRDLSSLRRNAIVFAATSFILLVGLLLFKPQLYLLLDRDVTLPEFLDMPALGQFGFGLGFGIFAGYWLRTIIFRKRDEKAGYREIALTALLGVLLVIGLVGERPLSRAFGRLTTLEAVGVKIGFSALSAKDGSIGPAYDSTSQSSRTSIAESEGLNLVYLLYSKENSAEKSQRTQIERDFDQIALLTVPTDAAPDAATTLATDQDKGQEPKEQQVIDVIKPLVDCALQHSKSNGDSNRLGDLLQPVAAAMRFYILKAERVKVPDFPPDVSQSLEDLRRETYPPCNLDGYEDTLKSLATMKQDDAYVYFATAGLLAYDHRYAAAIAMMDRWLKKKRPASNQKTIQSIRMRGFLLTLLEEWLHGLDFVRPDKAILDYQLDNIGEQIALFENASVLEAVDVVARRMKPADDKDRHYVAGRFMFPPDDHESCGFDKEKDRDTTALYLERSFISARLNWITVALDNPDYASKYAAKAKAYAKTLLNLDLSCLINIDDADSIDTTRANTLEAFARVSLAAYAQPDAEIGAEGTSMRQALERALQAVVLAEYLLDEPEKHEETAISSQATQCADEDASGNCMAHPVVKNFTKQSQVDLEVLKRHLKQALKSID